MRFITEILDRSTKLCCKAFCYLSVVALSLMICVIIFDVIGDNLFKRPLTGSVDIVGLLGLIVAAFALGETKIRGYHIHVDFITSMLPFRHQQFFRAISVCASMALLSFLIWGSLRYAAVLREVHEGTFTLGIPIFPFIYMIVIGCLPLWLLFFLDFLDALKNIVKKEDRK